jgi:hypothetical protein
MGITRLFCRIVRRQLAAFDADALPSGAARRIARHLDTCPQCRAEHAAAASVATLLRDVAPSDPPLDPTLWQTLQARIEHEAPRPLRTPRPETSPLPPLFAASALASALLVGAVTLQRSSTPSLIRLPDLVAVEFLRTGRPQPAAPIVVASETALIDVSANATHRFTAAPSAQKVSTPPSTPSTVSMSASTLLETPLGASPASALPVAVIASAAPVRAGESAEPRTRSRAAAPEFDVAVTTPRRSAVARLASAPPVLVPTEDLNKPTGDAAVGPGDPPSAETNTLVADAEPGPANGPLANGRALSAVDSAMDAVNQARRTRSLFR